jgi:hypothetical protein
MWPREKDAGTGTTTLLNILEVHPHYVVARPVQFR